MSTPIRYDGGFQEAMKPVARDTRALTDEVEHFDEPTGDMKRAARRVCAAFATDAEEAAMFMKMCGVHPSQWKDPVPSGVSHPPSRIV
jgi:hypothetical protein